MRSRAPARSGCRTRATGVPRAPRRSSTRAGPRPSPIVTYCPETNQGSPGAGTASGRMRKITSVGSSSILSTRVALSGVMPADPRPGRAQEAPYTRQPCRFDSISPPRAFRRDLLPLAPARRPAALSPDGALHPVGDRRAGRGTPRPSRGTSPAPHGLGGGPGRGRSRASSTGS